MGRQLRHWTKKVRQPFGAPTSGVRATSTTTPGGPRASVVHAIGQGDPGYKTTYHAWRTQKTTRTAQTQHHPQCQKETEQQRVSSAELAQELPFSEEPGTGPWDTPSERVESIKKSIKRSLRKKAAGVAKKKGKSLAKKALDWKTWKTP